MHATTGEHMTEEDEEFQRIEREAKMRRMAEEDDDIQVYKKPWVGLDHDELIERANQEECASVFSKGAIWGAARLREKNT
jgi:choline kinase